MKVTIAAGVLASILAVTCGIASAAAPDAWTSYQKEVASTCVEASGLRNARPAGDFIEFDDRVGYTALVIQGHYPQPHMKNRSGRVLCLFEKRSRIPYAVPADAIIAPGKR